MVSSRNVSNKPNLHTKKNQQPFMVDAAVLELGQNIRVVDCLPKVPRRFKSLYIHIVAFHLSALVFTHRWTLPDLSSVPTRRRFGPQEDRVYVEVACLATEKDIGVVTHSRGHQGCYWEMCAGKVQDAINTTKTPWGGCSIRGVRVLYLCAMLSDGADVVVLIIVSDLNFVSFACSSILSTHTHTHTKCGIWPSDLFVFFLYRASGCVECVFICVCVCACGG